MRKLLIIALSIIMVISLTGCFLDVVKTYAGESFSKLTALPTVQTSEDPAYYSITADGSNIFKISKDPGNTTADLVITLDAKPFIDAGLQPDKLGSGYAVNEGKLILSEDVPGAASPVSSATEALMDAVTRDRHLLSYHSDLDHFGIGMLGINKFEFAKDTAKNDKDMVFVLDAKTFTGAGVDADKLTGWVKANIKGTDVLLKIYSLD
jgi:hypothetical protein